MSVLKIEAAMRVMLEKKEIQEWLNTLGPYSDACEEEGFTTKANLARAVYNTPPTWSAEEVWFSISPEYAQYLPNFPLDLDFEFAGMSYPSAWLHRHQCRLKYIYGACNKLDSCMTEEELEEAIAKEKRAADRRANQTNA